MAREGQEWWAQEPKAWMGMGGKGEQRWSRPVGDTRTSNIPTDERSPPKKWPPDIAIFKGSSAVRTHQQGTDSPAGTQTTPGLSHHLSQQLQEHSTALHYPSTLSTPVFAWSLRLCQDLPHLPCSPKQSCKVRVLPDLDHLSLLLCPLSLSLHPSALWMLSLLLKCILFIQCRAVSRPLPQEAFLGCSHRIL